VVKIGFNPTFYFLLWQKTQERLQAERAGEPTEVWRPW
jgi:hypothetical protein